MQLILNPENTVDIKTKMSLNEENLEERVSSLLPIAINGNVSNGDITEVAIEIDNVTENDKIKQIKEAVAINAECEAKDVDAISNDADIDQSHKVKSGTDNAIDTVNGNEADKREELAEKSNIVEQTVSNVAGKKEANIEKATNLNESNKTYENELDDNIGINTESTDTDKADNSHENKEDSVCNNTKTESLDDSSIINDSTMKESSPAVQKEDNTESLNVVKESCESSSVIENGDDRVEIAEELNNHHSSDSVDISENVDAMKEHHGSPNAITEAKINDENTSDNSDNKRKDEDAKDLKEPEDITKAKALNENTVDENKGLGVQNLKETVEIVNDRASTETNSAMDTIETVTEKEVANDRTQSSDHEKATDINKAAVEVDSTKHETRENTCVQDMDAEIMEKNVDNNMSKEETNQIQTARTANLGGVEIGMDVDNASEENEEDIISLNDSNEILNAQKHEEIIKTKQVETVEEKCVDANKETDEPIESMEVDDNLEVTNEKCKTGTEIVSSADKSLQNADVTTDNVASDITKPVASENIDVLIPDSSTDVILDEGDKKEATEPVVDKESESNIVIDDNQPIINCDEDNTLTEKDNTTNTDTINRTEEIIDLDETASKDADQKKLNEVSKKVHENIVKKSPEEPKTIEPVLKLSNTLDILSDDEDAPKESNVPDKCIDIEDDDDIMLIDEDTSSTENKNELAKNSDSEKQRETSPANDVQESKDEVDVPVPEKEISTPEKEDEDSSPAPEKIEKVVETNIEKEFKKPLIHEKFLKTCKKNLSLMTKEELEEFCILKIVESVLDRSNLCEIKTKLKSLTQNIEDYKKKTMMLTKQNRDLQVVMKSIQEDQKKGVDSIVPLKITRSVGMQVMMADKTVQQKKKNVAPPPNNVPSRPSRNTVMQSPRPQKTPPQIPVPRLVPASPALKPPSTPPANAGKLTSPQPNGIRNVSPVQKPEKRTHNRIQSVTVDLTDDEPPTKVANRTQGPVPPVRLVPSQNLLANPRTPGVNSPRKVYIPISGPQGQSVRPGQTIMLKQVPNANPRQRIPPPQMMRMPSSIRMTRPHAMRHPAPLPDCMKQYQPPNWKALPPAPDLKLAKVENGIVISWKIEGYQEDSYEEIASYQLYAYQETTAPPNTSLWKKIGDVKALPLPMACTLTQFMAGFKYYFAVRAVDIRSRLGPFSLPGSILLLNKS